MTKTQTRYRFSDVARMEWVKVRSQRSTWVTLAITVISAVAIAAGVGMNTQATRDDSTNDVLAGIAPGLLLIGVLGVLVMTSEYTSGLIRLTLAAAPNRHRVIAAKAAVFGALALVVGELTAFLSFFVGVTALPSDIDSPALSQPGVLQAVVLAGAAYCLIGLIGLGIGAVVRHSGGAIAVLVGGVYVVAQLIGALSMTAASFVPVSIVANSLSTVEPMVGMPSAWAGLIVLCLYAAIALGVGGWLMDRRDA